ncbi:ATP-dependent DNA helicase [Nevskia soli]|uniref:ATP-dependent DNA helicase n=1 Tax=Nevskia soli TaxID=418856 RepID=UPI0004A6F54A|nr:ATP-dependent DNA helicase [Nevskia soli]
MKSQTAGELLGAKGPFSYSLPGFLPRAAQQEMADAVEQALQERSALVVEAGTGTGKTYAYLTPALMSGNRVVVSTGTKNLQDQLFFRDLPRVRDTLAVPARVSLLKGRANYLCLYRLRKAQMDPRSRVRRDRFQVVDEWAHRTSTGEISELGSIGNDDPILPAITSTADNCLGAKCPDFAECHVVKARRAAQAADLVVVNHHLLFSDFRLKQEGFGVLPGTDAIIVDEAHQLPELAAQFFGERVSTRQLLDLVRDTGTEMQEFRDMPGLTEAVDALAIAASELERPFLELGGRIAWRQFGTLPGATSALGAARNALGECSDELKRYAERSAGLDAVSQRARALVKRMDLITAADESPEAAATSVRWVESVGRGGALHTAPVEPTEGFRSFMAAYPGAWVFTSATLAAGKDFTHFTDTLGLTEARTLRLDSPFDYARQARLYLPRDLPDPNTPEHPEAVADMLLPLIEASGGGAFVLCTSHRALARIAAKFRKSAFPLFVQGEDAKSVLVDRFSRAGNGILVATSSFWEGVDVKGMALRLVAIDKLPFGQQNDPVFEARLEAVRARGGNPFSEVQLPRAITTLRQGVGRLIRDDADHGLIVICDPRIRGKSYGKRVLASLPAMPLLADAAEAAAWLRGLKAA